MSNKRGRPKKRKVGEIKFGDKIDTIDKRRQAIALLRSGLSSSFWIFITEVLDLNIEETKRIILEDDSITPEERENWRRWLYYQIQLRDLPENLIGEYDPDRKVEVPSLDVYD